MLTTNSSVCKMFGFKLCSFLFKIPFFLHSYLQRSRNVTRMTEFQIVSDIELSVIYSLLELFKNSISQQIEPLQVFSSEILL
jgi:hypothetical protein